MNNTKKCNYFAILSKIPKFWVNPLGYAIVQTLFQRQFFKEILQILNGLDRTHSQTLRMLKN